MRQRRLEMERGTGAEMPSKLTPRLQMGKIRQSWSEPPREYKRPRHRVNRDRQWAAEQRDRETEPETGERREEPPESRGKDPRQTQRDTQRPEIAETDRVSRTTEVPISGGGKAMGPE